MKDCNSCIHQRVCSLKGKYEDYKKEMEMLMKKWGDEKENPFGFTMNCPEWHEKEPKVLKINKMSEEEKDGLIKKYKEKVQPWIKKSKEEGVEPRITYDWNDSVDKTIKLTCEDEIMATKEPNKYDSDARTICYEGQPICEIIIGKHNKENYSIPQICVPTKGLAKKIENELARRMNDIDKYIK